MNSAIKHTKMILALSPLILLVLYAMCRVIRHILDIKILNEEFKREVRRLDQLEKEMKR